MDLSLILLNTSCEIYSIPSKLKYTTVFLSINNETQCIPLLCLSSKFLTYARSFIVGKLSFEKLPLNLASYLKYLVFSILLKGWSGTKNFDPYDQDYYIHFQLF